MAIFGRFCIFVRSYVVAMNGVCGCSCEAKFLRCSSGIDLA